MMTLIKFLIAAGIGLGVAAPVAGQTSCASYPNTFTSGETASASQVNANFACAALLGAANFGAPVGINDSAPAALLSLGNAITTIKLAAYNGGGSDIYGMGVNSGELTFGAAIAPTGVPQMVLTDTGKVGIGTTVPTSILDLSQAITTIKLAVYEDGTASNTYGIGVNSGELTFGAAITVTGTPQMVLTSSGYLGVGTTAPSYPLYVNGTAFATGAAGALSDKRYKTAITPLAPGALEIVEKLRPVTFLWKKPTDAGMQGEQIGFIAQDVQKTLPTVVMTQTDAEKTLGIKYDELIPVLTAAIQEEQVRVMALEAEVSALKMRQADITILKDEVAALEARLAKKPSEH